jgi:GTPase SAR1 family protein
MSEQVQNDFSDINVTGFVLPLGNGAVGKSSLALALDLENNNSRQITKSVNLEFGYISHSVQKNEINYRILQQFLVPPGQKQSEGMNGGRSFEKIIEIYRFFFKQIDVVLLSFKLTDLDTFNDLEFWVEQSLLLTNNHTQFFLVGTHLDLDNARQVSTSMIENGTEFVRNKIKENNPGWIGQVAAYEISNNNRQNLNTLRNAISEGILKSKQFIR